MLLFPAAAGLPLWVLPFEVLVTSSGTALIQLIPDATSVHSIKAHSVNTSSSSSATASATGTPRSPRPAPRPVGVPGARALQSAAAAAAGAAGAPVPPGASGCVSLSEHFFAKWERGSPECLAAQRRFVESLAGYSLITYLLQVRAGQTVHALRG